MTIKVNLPLMQLTIGAVNEIHVIMSLKYAFKWHIKES